MVMRVRSMKRGTCSRVKGKVSLHRARGPEREVPISRETARATLINCDLLHWAVLMLF